MQTLNRKIKNGVTWIFFGAWLSVCNTAWAESDMQLQEKALKARESSRHQGMDHSAHQAQADSSGGFRGVFYGYLPCPEKDCDGIKMTLSLKPKNNYLLVTQYARESSREYYEKGKYDWDDKNGRLTLNAKKDGSQRLFAIQDDGAIVQLNGDGSSVAGDQDAYTLRRSDKAKTREVHIH